MSYTTARNSRGVRLPPASEPSAEVALTACRLRIAVLLVAALVAPAGTARATVLPAADRGVPAAELLAGDLLAPDAPSVQVRAEEVLALTPEMREFLATSVDRRGSSKVKLHNLVAAIIDSGAFGLQYDAVTRTAAETFRARRGNCLSFAGMFAALARAVGLDARFQEVEVPPAWTLDNDTFVLNRHVNVRVDLGREGTRVVDFNIADFRASYPMRVIADRRAMAHYGNNTAVERMNAGDTAGALAYLRAALTNDPSFAPAWTNLGTLYQRAGHLSYAEAAYRQALAVSRWDLVAMSNLAALYERLGDDGRAAEYRARVVAHRMRNPYYRYNLAQQALSRSEVAAAIEHLTEALRLRPSEDQFCFLLGVAYLRAGREAQARKWFAEAERLAASSSLRFHYAAKISSLLHNGTPPQP